MLPASSKLNPRSGEHFIPEPINNRLWALPGSWIIGTAAVISLCLVTPVWILGSAQASPPIDATAATVTLVIYSGAKLSYLIAYGRPAILSGIFWLFTYVAMAVAPLCQLATGRHPSTADASFLLPATLLVLIGCVSYDVGGIVSMRVAVRNDKPTGMGAAVLIMDNRRLQILSIFAVLFATYSVAKVGIGFMFLTREGGAEAATQAGLVSSDGSQAGSAIMGALGSVPQLLAFLGWTSRLARGETRTPATWAWWLTLLSVNTVVNNPIGHSRYWFLTVVGSIIFCLPNLRASRFRAILITGIIAAILIFPYSDIFRTDAENRRPLDSHSIAETLSIKDYDQMAMVANGMWWTSENGYMHGRQMAGELLFWYPRTAWADKPIDTGVEIGTAMNLQNTNLSSPIWAEAWVDFGLVGTLCALFAVGWWSRRLDHKFMHSRTERTNTLMVDLAIPLIAAYQLILLRGPLLQSMGRLSMILLMLMLIRTPSNSKPQAEVSETENDLPNLAPQSTHTMR